jgi:hypothetical protein
VSEVGANRVLSGGKIESDLIGYLHRDRLGLCSHQIVGGKGGMRHFNNPGVR